MLANPAGHDPSKPEARANPKTEKKHPRDATCYARAALQARRTRSASRGKLIGAVLGAMTAPSSSVECTMWAPP